MAPAQLTTDELCSKIVAAVAERTDADPLEMNPLYGVVDVDALEALVASGGEVSARFTYEGHAVVVNPDGSVAVAEEAADAVEVER